MHNNSDGFTLIDLLSVIVILGLLLAIAVPNVSKYVNQSRKKTVVSSIAGYVASIASDVKGRKYNFSKTNTIYAVPIECASLEKGGLSPFGEWSPVNDDYWAYVLIQYNKENFSYKYGFTFKDSSGYGMYPTEQNEMDLKDGSQIKTGLNLTKPTRGVYTNLAAKENWLGFDIDDNTKLIVLESGTCSIPKPCIGDGAEAGDVVTCGNEKFNIISSTSTTVTVMAQYGINPNLNNPIQNANASGASFSFTNYWADGSTIKSEYGSFSPVFVYDENSNLYQYVEAYESYLKEYGITSANASLINHEQLEEIGCSVMVGGTCSVSWLKTGPFSLAWTGSIKDVGDMYRIMTPAGNVGSAPYTNTYIIRPVVTMAKSEIKFVE